MINLRITDNLKIMTNLKAPLNTRPINSRHSKTRINNPSTDNNKLLSTNPKTFLIIKEIKIINNKDIGNIDAI